MAELGNPLHLLRAILRECSYLPDPAARSYMHKYSFHQFRRNCPKHGGTGNKYLDRRVSLPKKVALFQRGRKHLSMLRRANEGYLKPLEKVLLITYGRVGKRRRQLLRNMLVSDIPQTHKDLENIVDVQKYSRQWRPSSLFRALAQSQMANKGRFDRSIRGRQNFLTQAEAVPAKNAWGRPMPQRRVRNLTHKWYVKVADNIFPPLPEIEWKRLQQLALRPPAQSQLPKRRKKVGDWGEKRDSALSEDVLLKGPQKGQTFAMLAKGRPHKITPRILSSIWAKIFAHVPHIVWDGQRWLVTWSKIGPKKKALAKATDEQSDLLFGSLDNHSQPP